MITVLLVDDQDMVRKGLRLLLQSEPDIEVVGEASDGQQGVELAQQLRPDVVVMDVRMPVMDGIAATAVLADPAQPDPMAVLVLTTYDMDEYVFAALRAGASGFLLKHASADELVAGIRAVATGDAVVAPSVTRRLIAHFTAAPPTAAREPSQVQQLTPREREVFDLVAQGASNGEIAESLFIESSTVKTHVANVLMKLGLRDRVQAVVYAYEHGLNRSAP